MKMKDLSVIPLLSTLLDKHIVLVEEYVLTQNFWNLFLKLLISIPLI